MSIINPTVHTAAIAALEAAANRALQLDPHSRRKLATLEGKVFHFACTRPELDLYLIPQQQQLKFLGFREGEVSTSICGEASDFAALATAEDAGAALINGKLELLGDSAALIELQKILSGLDPDWEAPLVDAFGDVAGHQLAEALRGLFNWGQQASGSLARQLQEFIQEEARLSPPRLEVEDFYRDVEQLRQRVERLQARLRKFATALAGE